MKKDLATLSELIDDAPSHRFMVLVRGGGSSLYRGLYIVQVRSGIRAQQHRPCRA